MCLLLCFLHWILDILYSRQQNPASWDVSLTRLPPREMPHSRDSRLVRCLTHATPARELPHSRDSRLVRCLTHATPASWDASLTLLPPHEMSHSLDSGLVRCLTHATPVSWDASLTRLPPREMSHSRDSILTSFLLYHFDLCRNTCFYPSLNARFFVTYRFYYFSTMLVNTLNRL